MDPIQSSRRLYYIPLFLLLLQKRRNPITFLVYSAAGAFSYFPYFLISTEKKKNNIQRSHKTNVSLLFLPPLFCVKKLCIGTHTLSKVYVYPVIYIIFVSVCVLRTVIVLLLTLYDIQPHINTHPTTIPNIFLSI